MNIRKRIVQGALLIAGFVPLAYAVSTKILYIWPGLADAINYGCTAVLIWFAHKGETS